MAKWKEMDYAPPLFSQALGSAVLHVQLFYQKGQVDAKSNLPGPQEYSHPEVDRIGDILGNIRVLSHQQRCSPG